ncbi:MAG: UDP-N-acetylmuramoyl-tripeptide--D-alanyl-D-alanine ligase [Crocinitomicaceae bacterium]|nr:UDP-N-acetylmuramoyl-tripeptide--D-alanyl-D-alanine ligase [Crocinitomicaceae bacterium]
MENLFAKFYETKGVSTDTRNIHKECFFIALKGTNFNGNHFAEEAIKQGAKYAIVDEAEFVDNENIFFVSDTLKFLQKLANHHRNKFSIPLIGITGSNGKTSTKELINVVLSKKYNVLCTAGNLNNHIGVPLTLLQLNNQHEIAIIEMGANKHGDIEELCSIAEPNFGIITNIGKAHLEGFINFEGVLKTKSELYESVKSKNGMIVLNNDDEVLKKQALKFGLATFTYASQNEGDIRGELVKLTPFVNLKWANNSFQSETIETQMVGKYNFYNFLAAISFGCLFEVSPSDVNNALATYLPRNNRSQVSKTETNTLIIDCYNANPSSMKVALESFLEINHPNKIALIGDMFELGNDSFEEHQKIVQFCIDKEIHFHTVGNYFKEHNAKGFSDVSEAKIYFTEHPIKEALILLKGSRGIALEKLIESL